MKDFKACESRPYFQFRRLSASRSIYTCFFFQECIVKQRIASAYHIRNNITNNSIKNHATILQYVN